MATGTRADWGLLQPLASTLRERGADVVVFATHQHLIHGMGDTLREIRHDGFEPYALVPAEGRAPEIMAHAAAGFAEVLPGAALDALVILGDRCEMLGVCSAALLCGVPVVHIAGGTVSEGAFDDSVRNAITKMATLHFPETDLCRSRILQMGEDPECVIAAGALGVENTLKVKRMTRHELADSLDGWEPGDRFLVVTLHAATLESASPLAIQDTLLDELAALPEDWRFILTYPNSDVDPTPLIRSLHSFEQRMAGRAKVVPSLGRVRYLSAAALSMGVVGNSSSALVEVPSLGVPSLDIGIRQQGREHGPSVIHAEATREGIAGGLRRLLSEETLAVARKRDNPYSRHDTASLMAERIMAHPFHPYPSKTFHKWQDTSI